MTHGVAERAESGAGRLGRQSPDRRPRGDDRPPQLLGGEVGPDHVGDAALRPLKDGRNGPWGLARSAGHPAEDRPGRGRGLGQLGNRAHYRKRGAEVPLVAGDLGGVGMLQ